MIIHDPIYGEFRTPAFLDDLIMSPEVRRLAEIRLLNAPSPSLATLSEIRRLSHTLGVLYLALQNPQVGLSKEEVRAFLAAILIHDAATPPFAHLLEYYLKDRTGWDHETAIAGMLTGHGLPGNVAFQILLGESIVYQKLCTRANVEFDLVLDIVSKRHPASKLLFGSIDFDNLDNVIRMAWALGIEGDRRQVILIARNLQLSLGGELLLSRDLESAVQTWAAIRKSAYDILAFDEFAVSAQAVLTKAIRLRYRAGGLNGKEWAQRDRDLVESLQKSELTKSFMVRHFAHLPRQVVLMRIDGSLRSLGFESRDAAIDWVEHAAQEWGGLTSPIGYVFVDNGAFSKRLVFKDPDSRASWEVGKTSQSVIFYCFAGRHDRSSEETRRRLQDAIGATLLELKSKNADESIAVRDGSGRA